MSLRGMSSVRFRHKSWDDVNNDTPLNKRTPKGKWKKLKFKTKTLTLNERDWRLSVDFKLTTERTLLEFTCRWGRKAPSSRSEASTRTERRHMGRRWMRRIVEHGSPAGRGMPACCKSDTAPTPPDSLKASGSVSVERRRHRHKCESTSRSPTSRTSLVCDGHRHSADAFVFRRLQILYFLREMVLN